MINRALQLASACCALCACLAVLAAAARAQAEGPPEVPPAPGSTAAAPTSTPALPNSSTDSISSTHAGARLTQFLASNVASIDLFSALRLVGEQNPQVLIAQQRVIEALALRQLAAAQFLPTLNAGSSVNSHRGVLQESGGQILQVNRDSLYAGAGAFAVGGGTVNIPGVVLTGNVAVWIYDFLVAEQEVDRRGFVSDTVAQDTSLAAAVAAKTTQLEE